MNSFWFVCLGVISYSTHNSLLLCIQQPLLAGTIWRASDQTRSFLYKANTLPGILWFKSNFSSVLKNEWEVCQATFGLQRGKTLLKTKGVSKNCSKVYVSYLFSSLGKKEMFSDLRETRNFWNWWEWLNYSTTNRALVLHIIDLDSIPGTPWSQEASCSDSWV